MPTRTHRRRPLRRTLTDRLAGALAFGACGAGPHFAEIARQLARAIQRSSHRTPRVLHPA